MRPCECPRCYPAGCNKKGEVRTFFAGWGQRLLCWFCWADYWQTQKT